MITINLLPENYRKLTVSSVQQFHRSPLAFLIVIVLVSPLLILGTLWKLRQAQAGQLITHLSQLDPQKTEADQLKTSVQALRDQQAALQRLSRERRQWTKLLNRLSDVTPDGVWYTDLSLDQQQGFVVQGAAISQGGEEMVRIGRLVQDLKADPNFSSMIQDIQIESIKTVQEKEVEVVEFTLTCKLGTSPAGIAR